MNPREPDLETLLRQAPHPSPPPGLREELLRAAPAPRVETPVTVTPGIFQSWLNSWRFALTAACLALVALGLAAAQQAELRELRRQVEELRLQLENHGAPPTEKVVSAPPAAPAAGAETNPVDPERQDLERLRAELAKLQSEQTAASRLAAENQQIRSNLTALVQQAMPGEFEAIREARERAQRIACVNNLKQLGLSVRVFAVDNNDVFPPDIQSMSNEVSSLKVPICPADTNRHPATSWATFSAANSSYEYLAADGRDTDPYRVLFRCTVHRGNVGLCDGSVQQLTDARQASQLFLRDGKLYLKGGPEPAPKAGRQP